MLAKLLPTLINAFLIVSPVPSLGELPSLMDVKLEVCQKAMIQILLYAYLAGFGIEGLC
jgi:hypothetical protein